MTSKVNIFDNPDESTPARKRAQTQGDPHSRNRGKAFALDNLLAVIPVRCQEHTHRVVVLRDGRLVFPDHGIPVTLEDELAERAGEAPKHRCGALCRSWRKSWSECQYRFDADRFEIQLISAADVLCREHGAAWKRRYTRRIDGNADALATDLKTRLQIRLRNEATAALQRCSYRKPLSHLYNQSVRVCDASDHSNIRGTSEREYSYNESATVTKAELNVHVGLTWLSRVAAKGFAVLDGCFVIDVIREREDGCFVVRAGRQGRGFSVNVAAAIWDPAKFQLRWI